MTNISKNPVVNYQQTDVIVNSPDSVLDGLEKAGFKIPFSCRSGLCQSCMMQADSSVPAAAQQGLTDNQKAQHFFLACSCFPKDNMNVSLIGDVNQSQVTVTEKSFLNESVLKLCLNVDFKWFAGQYVSVWFDEIQGRSYSIASRYDNDRTVELHIKRHDLGLVSRWLHDDVKVGDTLTVSKPLGSCFYTDAHADSPLLMASTGTGLAPLYGILKEALHREHSASIVLYSGAGEPADLYYVDELTALSERYENFSYIPVVRRKAEAASRQVVEQDLVALIAENYSDLRGWKVFLCGNVDMIKKVQRHCFFQGATASDILVDAFIIDKPPAIS